MNCEFIVWNKYSKEFIEEKYLNMYASSADGKYFYDCSDPYEFSESLYCKNEYEIFNYIGITDIDGKKIYADCSIVEFEYRDYRYMDIKKAFGYFNFNNDKKCLEFINFDSMLKINFVMHIEFILKLKIIDTIQENKLGFIK